MEHPKEIREQAQLAVADRTLPTEITAEFILPDYRSEISRLLLVRPSLTPPELFVAGGRVELSGMARYEILYTGPDGHLYGAELGEGYHFSHATDLGADLVPTFTAACAPDAVTARVTGPRKLSIRTRIHTRLMGYAEKTLGVQTKNKAASKSEICHLCDMIKVAKLLPVSRETVLLSDSVEEASDVRVILSRANAYVSEVVAGDSCVRCRGEVILSLLLAHEDEVPYTLTRRIPFERDVTMEESTPNCRARATGSVSELRVNVEEGALLCELSLTLCAEAQAEEEIAVCRDLFLPGAVAECRFSTEPLFLAGECQNRHFSLSAECTRGEAGLENATLIDLFAEPEIEEKTVDGARFSISGQMKCHLLCKAEEELFTRDVSLPFRVTTEEQASDAVIEASLPLLRPTLTENALRVDAELLLSMRGFTPSPTKTLCEAAFVPCEDGAREGCVTLYYPSEGETLWDVAKRYGCTPDALADANGIEYDAPNDKDSLGTHNFVMIS